MPGSKLQNRARDGWRLQRLVEQRPVLFRSSQRSTSTDVGGSFGRSGRFLATPVAAGMLENEDQPLTARSVGPDTACWRSSMTRRPFHAMSSMHSLEPDGMCQRRNKL